MQASIIIGIPIFSFLLACFVVVYFYIKQDDIEWHVDQHEIDEETKQIMGFLTATTEFTDRIHHYLASKPERKATVRQIVKAIYPDRASTPGSLRGRIGRVRAACTMSNYVHKEGDYYYLSDDYKE